MTERIGGRRVIDLQDEGDILEMIVSPQEALDREIVDGDQDQEIETGDLDRVLRIELRSERKEKEKERGEIVDSLRSKKITSVFAR